MIAKPTIPAYCPTYSHAVAIAIAARGSAWHCYLQITMRPTGTWAVLPLSML